MTEKLRVLIIEDSEVDAMMIVKLLKTGGFSPDYKRVQTRKDMLIALGSQSWDIIISDYVMPNFDGKQAFEEFKKLGLEIPFIIISGQVDEEVIIELMKAGVHDYVMKNNYKRLVPAVKRELKEAEIRRERRKAIDDIQRLNEELELRVQMRTAELEEINRRLIDEMKFRKKANHELYYTKVLLNSILENIPNMIIVKKLKDKTIQYINKAVEDLAGYKREDVIGKSIDEIFPKHLAEIYKKDDEKLLENGEPIIIPRETTLTSDGINKYFHTIKTLIRNEEDIPDMILSISSDTTEIIRALDDLEKSEQRFHSIFDNSPIAMALVDSENNILNDVNHSYCKLVGYRRGELLGKTAEELGLWPNPEERNDLMQEVMETGSCSNREIRIKNKSGQVVSVLISLERILIDNQNYILFQGLDISERIAIAEKTQVALEKQKELNMLKTQFISMISHEFRTPLTTIMLSTDLLKRYSTSWSEEEKQKHYERIQKTILQMIQLMENVLVIGRMESGKFVFHPDNIEPKSFFKSLSKNIEYNTNQKNRINLNINDDYEQILCDENLLGLIVSNLLTNAVKYSPKNSEVQLNINCKDDEMYIEVVDHGIGIPQDQLTHLFQSFFRARNVGNIEGYGLGLSIVKRSVDAHHGLIEAESEQNKGTTFKVTLPINSRIEKLVNS